MPVPTAPSAEPAPRFRRWSATARAARLPTGNLRRFEQAAALADETGAPPGAVEPFTAAAGLVSVFRVNLKGRDSDTEPPGQHAERALGLLEHGPGDYVVSPAPPPAPQSRNAGSARITAAPSPASRPRIRRFFVCVMTMDRPRSVTAGVLWPGSMARSFRAGRGRWRHLRIARGSAADYRDGRPGASG